MRWHTESNILDKTPRLAHSVIGRSNVHKWWTVCHPAYARIKYMDTTNKICTTKRSRDVRMSGKYLHNIYIYGTYFAHTYTPGLFCVFPCVTPHRTNDTYLMRIAPTFRILNKTIYTKTTHTILWIWNIFIHTFPVYVTTTTTTTLETHLSIFYMFVR